MTETTISVAAFLLADHAEVINGKLYTMGAGWDRLTLPADQLQAPSIALATVIRVPWTASNQPHRWEVAIASEDGKNVLGEQPPNGEFETGRPPGTKKGSPSTVMFSMTLANLRFPSAGGYVATISIDGTPVASAPFTVVSQ